MRTQFPSDWQLLPIEKCMEAIIDYRGKSPEKTNWGIPLITAKIVKNGRILPPDEFIRPEDYEEWMRRGIPKKGDIVITTEAPLGEIAQLDNPKIALAQRLITLRGKSDLLDNNFLKFAMQSEFVQDQLKARASGTTVFGIRQSELIKVEIPLPPLPTQHAIARILGSLDDKIEINRQMNETLEAMARAIFQSWFVDFDPVRAKVEGRDTGLPPEIAALFPDGFEEIDGREVPRGCGVVPLSDSFDVRMGQSPSGTTYNENGEGIPFFQGRTDFGFRYPSVRVYCTAPTRFAEAGDTLVSVRAPVGDINLTQEKCCIGRGVAAVRHKTGSRSFTYYQMLSFKDIFVVFESEGTVFGSITKTDFNSIECITPPNEIVKKFEEITFPIDQTIENNEQQSRTLAQIGDALLPKLISGKINVSFQEKLLEAQE